MVHTVSSFNFEEQSKEILAKEPQNHQKLKG